jgi:hypothetical protein
MRSFTLAEKNAFVFLPASLSFAVYYLFFIYEFHLAGECISNDPPVPSEELYRQWAGQYGSVRPLRGLNHRTMLIQVRRTCTVYRQWAGKYVSVRTLRGLNHRTMLIQVRETVHCTVQTMDGTANSIDTIRTILT